MSGENGNKERSYFGERLRQLRESKGMSIQDLAYCLSVHKGRRVQSQEVTKFEDKTRNPSIKTIRLLSKVFDVSPSYFIPIHRRRVELPLNDNNDLFENGDLHRQPLETGIVKLIEAYRNKDLATAIEILALLNDDSCLIDIQGDIEREIVEYYINGNKWGILNIFLARVEA